MYGLWDILMVKYVDLIVKEFKFYRFVIYY